MNKVLIAFLVSFFIIGYAVAQQITPDQQASLSSTNLSTVNVDNISDAQLKLYLERAEKAGYTDNDVASALKMRGLPAAEIQKLQVRIQKIRQGTKTAGTSYTRARTREKSEAYTEDFLFDALVKDYTDLMKEDELEQMGRIFGYKLFNSSDLSFEPSLNLATPKDYQVGPGDEIIIDVWGASEQTYQEIVSPDGYIKIPNLGPIFINGYSMDKASERIISRLTQIYSGLANRNGSSPNTYAQVSLGQARTITVHVIGEAYKPGSFNLSSLSNVSHALYLSGGPGLNGSMRYIDLIRDNKVIAVVDVYEFLMNGVLENNLRLQDGDLIRINPYKNRVEAQGEVKRPGIYEVKDEETFKDLISFTGGFTETAYTELIKVKRNNGKELQFLDLKRDEFESTSPKNGDFVNIQGVLERFANRVQIKGAVFREGEYELSEGLKISQLVEIAEGLRGDAFLERGVVFRTNEDYSFTVIPFNLRNIIKGEDDDILLQREDLVNIPSIYDLKEEFFLTIFGEVRNSGTYPFHYDMTVEDLIIRAGGLKESASGSRVEVARRIQSREDQAATQTAEIFTFTIDKDLRLNGNSSDFKLQPFDQVFIRKSPGYQPQINVKVEGEVMFPGTYALTSNDERISDLLNRAGGIAPNGFAEGATLIRRTEFNPAKTDEQVRLENLKELYDGVTKGEKDMVLESESELLLQKRLQNVEKELKDYNEAESDEQGIQGIKVRRQRLDELLDRDTLITKSKAVQYETIGIQLEKIIQNPGSKADIVLQEGDILSVPRKLETVRLRGEFLYPITARYENGKRFSYYISQAGGFTQDAKKSKSYVLYANGSVDRTKSFLGFKNYPKIEPGAEIIVPRKPEKEKIGTQGWIAISTSVATLGLIVTQVLNNIR